MTGVEISQDGHQRSDTIGTLWAVVPMLRWLRESLHEHADGAAVDTRLVEAAGQLSALLGVGAASAEVEDLLERLRERVAVAAAGVRDLGDDDVHRLLTDVEEQLHRIGGAVADIAPMTGEGRVEGVFASEGGVPKLPVERADVGPRGLMQDRQRSRRHHGKPMQALCLYSSEVIESLRGEGHTIAPGAAGENVVIRGLDWSSLRPFLRLRVGTVLAELSAPATPCAKNARWFVGGEMQRIDHDLHPGWSRWYAWVLEPGEIAVGDRAVIGPDRG